MGTRNILILFFSTMAISLVILVVLFNLVFKNIDMTFDTRIPESAPTMDTLEIEEQPDEPQQERERNLSFRANGIRQSKIDVPGFAPAPPPEEAQSEADINTAEEAGTADTPEEPGSTDDVVEQDKDTAAAEGPVSPTTVSTRSGVSRPRIPNAPPVPRDSLYMVYLDGFGSEAGARERLESLQASGIDSFLSRHDGKVIIKLGTFSTRESADALARRFGARIEPVSP